MSSLRKILDMNWSGKSVNTDIGKIETKNNHIPKSQQPKQNNIEQFSIVQEDINLSKLETKIIIPDIHSYARDKKAFALCMESVRVLTNDFNVTEIVQLGDLLECGELSQHGSANVYEKIPEYEEEVAWARDEFWSPIIKYAPKAKLVHLLGNHEDRMHKHIIKNMNVRPGKRAQALYEDMMPTDIYNELGVEVIPYGEDTETCSYYLAEKLICVHGWSFSTHAAKVHLDKAGDTSVIFGHTHRMQSYVRKKAMGGELLGAYSFGSLARNNMFYQKGMPNDHTNGFGIVHTDGKYFNPITIPVLMDGNDKIVVLPHGEKLKARS